MAQVVEHILGKDEVPGSSPGISSTMTDIPNLNCYGSIEMSFIIFKSSRERLSRPFLIFYFCADNSFRFFLLTRLMCRSKSPLLISSVRTYCIKVGTVQE